MRPMLSYQQPVYDWSCTKQHAGFFLEKRLGKCTMATRWALHWGCRHVLVVAPLSACPGWLNELEADGQVGVLLYGTRLEREQILLAAAAQKFDGTLFGVINPEGLHQKGEPTKIATMSWDCVIWDESYTLQNPQSKINAVAHASFANVPHRAILTGEPAPEGPLSLYEQLKWLRGGNFMGHRKFWSWRNENFQHVGYDYVPKTGRMAFIREAMSCHCYRLTRKAAGIGEQKTFERRYCDLPQKVRKAYDELELNWEIPISGEEFFMAKHAIVVRTKLNQLAGGYPYGLPGLDSNHKLRLLLTLLRGEYAKDKAVVSFRHNSELFAVQEALEELDIPCVVLTGAVAPADRKIAQQLFATTHRVLLGQAKVLMYGIDLSAADLMIRVSLPDSYNTISQSMDRIIHPQKKRPLHYIDIVCKDTTDEDRIEALFDKRSGAQYFMTNMFKNFAARLARKRALVCE